MCIFECILGRCTFSLKLFTEDAQNLGNKVHFKIPRERVNMEKIFHLKISASFGLFLAYLVQKMVKIVDKKISNSQNLKSVNKFDWTRIYYFKIARFTTSNYVHTDKVSL